MDKMFDLLFCYGISSFLHTNTSSRLIFRVRLSELPVQLAVLRGRLIASWVHLIILSAWFVSWPLWFIVLRVWLITDHIGSSFHHGILSFHYSATETKFSYLRFLHNNKVWTLQVFLVQWSAESFALALWTWLVEPKIGGHLGTAKTVLWLHWLYTSQNSEETPSEHGVWWKC